MKTPTRGGITKDARVLITGGTSGIGLATALLASARDARVAVIARNEAGLAAARERTAAIGRPCITFAADVTDRDALTAQVQAAAAALGGIDVAIVNVGVSTYGRFRDTPPDDFDRVIDVTFRGAVDTVRAVLPALEQSSGSLVIVGSVASTLPLPRMAAYTAAKHALRGFVESLRAELKAQSSGVAVALIEPGPVDTPFWGNVASADGLLPPRIPFAYRPQEVAKAIDLSLVGRDRDITVGGFWVLPRIGYRLARPIGRRALSRLTTLIERHGSHGPGQRSIRHPSGQGALDAELPGTRRSLAVGIRGLRNRRLNRD